MSNESDDQPTIITVGSIERGKHWLSNARDVPFYGQSPAMQALGLALSFEEACKLINEYDALKVKRD